MSWHSGIKKPSFILIAMLGALLGFNQIDATDVTQLDNNIGGVIAAAGAAGYLVEKKRDTKNKAATETNKATLEKDKVTKDELQQAIDSTWDVDMFHNTVVLPLAERRHKQFNQRFPWALQVFYSAQSKCARVHNDRKWWYLYSLSLEGFRAVWGMTIEEAVKKIPEWKASCQGSSLEAHAGHMGIGYQAIYHDVLNYADDYKRTYPDEAFVPFDADYQPEDYVKAGELVAHVQG
jgi:hypothetical protein